MKKNLPKAKNNSRPARPVSNSENAFVFDPSKKVWIITAAAFLVVGVGLTCFFMRDKLFNSENRSVTVTMADGSSAKMTVAELRDELGSDKFFEGIIIDGIDLSGKTKQEALTLLSDQVQNNAPKIDLSYEVNGTSYPLDLSSIPMDNNMEEVVNEAFSYGRPAEDASKSELIECFSTVQDLKNTPKNYTTEHTVSTEGVGELVRSFLIPFNKEAADAKVSGFDASTCKFTATEAVDGCKLDIEKAITDTKALLDNGTYQGTIKVDATVTKATKTADDVLQGYGLIASKASDTNSNNDRNHNINQACKIINGTFLAPGETFSFNGTVGKRTVEAGFYEAPTIMGGESVDAPGGGICQVSSMLFHAVVRSDLQVNERYPHQWPATYCDRGTDATVDWDSNMDFKFTNTSGYPVAISAYYDVNNYRVSVAIYGHLPEDGSYIAFIAETVDEGELPETKYTANPELPVGEENVKKKPHPYYYTKSYKVWYDKNGNEIKREEYLSTTYSAQKGDIEVGVLCPDGSIAELDTETGEVIVPDSVMTSETSATTEGSDVYDPNVTTSTDATYETNPTDGAQSTDDPDSIWDDDYDEY